MRQLRSAIVLAAALFGTTPVLAQNWYDLIVPEKSHDFGTVARGSKVRHSFRIVNTTNYDVHIANWRTKCGCTDVKIGAREIPPGTQTTVEVTLDTTKFVGYKPSGLILVFDRPAFAEVDLALSSFIRGDVMLNPGVVDYGVVPRGDDRTVSMNLSYHGGRPDWAITRINTISDHIVTELRPLNQSAGGPIYYQLTTTLKADAPSGVFKDEITLFTNDPEAPTIPISVAATIQAPVTVSPSVLNLGRLRPGQVKKQVILIRAAQPFKVTKASSPRPELTASGNLGDPKPFHSVTVTFTAPTQPGPYNTVLEIDTDLKDEPPTRLNAFANVVP